MTTIPFVEIIMELGKLMEGYVDGDLNCTRKTLCNKVREIDKQYATHLSGKFLVWVHENDWERIEALEAELRQANETMQTYREQYKQLEDEFNEEKRGVANEQDRN